MGRTKSSQSKHNTLVRKIANQLKKQGFDVLADVSGFGQPDTYGGFRPGVVAKNGKIRKIVEVETPDSVDSTRDQKQQKAFKNTAARSKATTFIRKVTK